LQSDGFISGETPVFGGEIAALTELFPKAQVFRGINTQRTQFIAAVGQADILHIASHYAFNSQRPELSQLALATEGASAQQFYAFEAALLNTHAKLTVLSACGTARGEVHPGEGLVNLGRAFLLAGSRAAMLSLWPVEEESTTQLMGHFYRLLAQGQDTREALRGAKLALRETARWWHPFYWGAFVLVGNPAMIQEKRGNGMGLAIVAATVLAALALLTGVLILRKKSGRK
jgi:CHAT domain-containing protein